MKVSTVNEERFLIDRGTDAKRALRTSWGEESYVKVGSTLSNNAFSLLDYRAPAGFGVVRHLHYREDEVLHLVEGRNLVEIRAYFAAGREFEQPFVPAGAVNHVASEPSRVHAIKRGGLMQANEGIRRVPMATWLMVSVNDQGLHQSLRSSCR
jgi:hypothetical protein